MRPLTLSNNFCEKVARISLRLRDASRAQGSRELGFRLAVGLDVSFAAVLPTASVTAFRRDVTFIAGS